MNEFVPDLTPGFVVAYGHLVIRIRVLVPRQYIKSPIHDEPMLIEETVPFPIDWWNRRLEDRALWLNRSIGDMQRRVRHTIEYLQTGMVLASRSRPALAQAWHARGSHYGAGAPDGGLPAMTDHQRMGYPAGMILTPLPTEPLIESAHRCVRCGRIERGSVRNVGSKCAAFEDSPTQWEHDWEPVRLEITVLNNAALAARRDKRE